VTGPASGDGSVTRPADAGAAYATPPEPASAVTATPATTPRHDHRRVDV
jgi:hypothetical protein